MNYLRVFSIQKQIKHKKKLIPPGRDNGYIRPTNPSKKLEQLEALKSFHTGDANLQKNVHWTAIAIMNEKRLEKLAVKFVE